MKSPAETVMTDTNNEISFDESKTLPDPLYIDVRSPAEYTEDHVPGAINIPLFDNQERTEVGILYKVVGRDEAVIRGTEIVGQKLPSIVEQFLHYREHTMIIYCSRGGMRSGSVVSLLSSLGIRTYRLKDGYKGYRHHITDSLSKIRIKPQLFILQGLTGVGKTEIIRLMEHSIDLEAMAGHRSSLFGGLGLEQKTQKSFESSIISRINELQNAPYAIIEGESRKIGNLHIPEELFRLMRQAPVILVNADIERRIDILLREYVESIDTDSIHLIVESLRTKLGSETVNTLLSLFEKNELREFTKILLEKYYDPLYKHTIGKMTFIGSVDNHDSLTAATAVRSVIEGHI